MDADRKRSRVPEESVTKRPKLEDSPSSEHEIALHATYDDDLLSSPVTTDGNPEKGKGETWMLRHFMVIVPTWNFLGGARLLLKL